MLRIGAAYLAVAWLLIQVAQTLFPVFGLGATAIRSVVVVLIVGLLPALIFAWAFEITPEGLKRESEVDRSQSITPQTGKKLDRVIMGVLALALGYFAVDKFVLAPQREQAATEAARAEGRTESLVKSYGDKSIAVLPFVNMSSDKDQEYFSDGISEELLNLLAKIPKLRVISRSSAFSYKGKDVKLAQVAKELNVAHILEGSVRKAGNKVRITAQLIEARSDTHLWSNTWDRELDDIFAVQDEIAAAVVEQLKITLLGEAPKAKEVNPEAYALFLQGRQLRRQSTPEGLEQAIALFQQALAIDPNYAAAWEQLAAVYVNQAGLGMRPLAEGVRLAREAAAKALAIDPDYAPAHGRLGWIAMSFDARPGGGGPTLRARTRAGTGQHRHHRQCRHPGRESEPPRHGDRAQRIRERPRPAQHCRPCKPGPYLPRRRAPGRGHRQFPHGAAPGPRLWRRACTRIGVALLMKGDAQAALTETQKEPEEVWRLLGLTMVYHTLGRKADSDAALAEMIKKYAADCGLQHCVRTGLAQRARPRVRVARQGGDPARSGPVRDRVPAVVRQSPRRSALAAVPAQDRQGARATRGDQVRREGAELVEVAHRSSDGCP